MALFLINELDFLVLSNNDNLHNNDKAILEAQDILHICNIFYMTFEPLKRHFQSKVDRFMNSNYIIVKEGSQEFELYVLPG